MQVARTVEVPRVFRSSAAGVGAAAGTGDTPPASERRDGRQQVPGRGTPLPEPFRQRVRLASRPLDPAGWQAELERALGQADSRVARDQGSVVAPTGSAASAAESAAGAGQASQVAPVAPAGPAAVRATETVPGAAGATESAPGATESAPGVRERSGAAADPPAASASSGSVTGSRVGATADRSTSGTGRVARPTRPIRRGADASHASNEASLQAGAGVPVDAPQMPELDLPEFGDADLEDATLGDPTDPRPAGGLEGSPSRTAAGRSGRGPRVAAGSVATPDPPDPLDGAEPADLFAGSDDGHATFAEPAAQSPPARTSSSTAAGVALGAGISAGAGTRGLEDEILADDIASFVGDDSAPELEVLDETASPLGEAVDESLALALTSSGGGTVDPSLASLAGFAAFVGPNTAGATAGMGEEGFDAFASLTAEVAEFLDFDDATSSVAIEGLAHSISAMPSFGQPGRLASSPLESSGAGLSWPAPGAGEAWPAGLEFDGSGFDAFAGADAVFGSFDELDVSALSASVDGLGDEAEVAAVPDREFDFDADVDDLPQEIGATTVLKRPGDLVLMQAHVNQEVGTFGLASLHGNGQGEWLDTNPDRFAAAETSWFLVGPGDVTTFSLVIPFYLVSGTFEVVVAPDPWSAMARLTIGPRDYSPGAWWTLLVERDGEHLHMRIAERDDRWHAVAVTRGVIGLAAFGIHFLPGADVAFGDLSFEPRPS